MLTMKIRNKKDLENVLKKAAKKALETEVAKTAKKTMKDKIDLEVYDAYTPHSIDGSNEYYKRTYKLRDKAVKTSMVNDTTLLLYNDRFDEDEQIDEYNRHYHDSGRYIPSVIESGRGYEWVEDQRIGARPFGKATYEELKNGKFKESFKKGLQKQGFKTK